MESARQPVETLAQEGHRMAKLARAVTGNLNAYLSACQLGITLASLGLGWVGEPAIADMLKPLFAKMGLGEVYLHSVSFVIAFTLITSLHITLGEQFPKT